MGALHGQKYTQEQQTTDLPKGLLEHTAEFTQQVLQVY